VSACLGVNRKYTSGKDIQSFTTSEVVYRSQKPTNEMDGPSITKDHGAKQVRKLKVSLPEIVLVEGSSNRSRSKSRHSYCPRRHDEDMHMHKVVPVTIDIRERKEVSVLVLLHEHHVRIQHAIDYRLYDLSKSKRLEGKMRREEIFRRISYPKTNSNECSAW